MIIFLVIVLPLWLTINEAIYILLVYMLSNKYYNILSSSFTLLFLGCYKINIFKV